MDNGMVADAGEGAEAALGRSPRIAVSLTYSLTGRQAVIAITSAWSCFRYLLTHQAEGNRL